MTSLIQLYRNVFDPISRAEWILPTLARLVFALVFLVYFINAANTKLDGGLFSPSAGAFVQIFPVAAEAASYDITQMTAFQRVVVFFGTLAEFILPVLIVLGLLTRLSSLAMIGFIGVQTLVDVTGHNVKFGSWLNNSYELIDERSLWVLLLCVLVVKGPGPLSIDAIIRKSFR